MFFILFYCRPIHGSPCKKSESKISESVYTFFRNNNESDLKWMLNKDGQTYFDTITMDQLTHPEDENSTTESNISSSGVSSPSTIQNSASTSDSLNLLAIRRGRIRRSAVSQR